MTFKYKIRKPKEEEQQSSKSRRRSFFVGTEPAAPAEPEQPYEGKGKGKAKMPEQNSKRAAPVDTEAPLKKAKTVRSEATEEFLRLVSSVEGKEEKLKELVTAVITAEMAKLHADRKSRGLPDYMLSAVEKIGTRFIVDAESHFITLANRPEKKNVEYKPNPINIENSRKDEALQKRLDSLLEEEKQWHALVTSCKDDDSKHEMFIPEKDLSEEEKKVLGGSLTSTIAEKLENVQRTMGGNTDAMYQSMSTIKTFTETTNKFYDRAFEEVAASELEGFVDVSDPKSLVKDIAGVPCN